MNFEFLAKFGILGYLLFLFSIFLLLKMLYKREKYFFYIGLVFLSMFIISSFGVCMNENNIEYKEYQQFKNIYLLVIIGVYSLYLTYVAVKQIYFNIPFDLN